MVRSTSHRASGFTVVETLIVIVVIAILARITVVAYTGVQQRSRNAQVATSVATYRKVLTLYKLNNGAYPTHGTTTVCLGTEYVGDNCWAGSTPEDATFMAPLQSISGSTLPSSNVGTGLKGITYTPAANGNQLDGVNTNWIAYIVVGSSSKCPVGPVATYVSGQSFSSTAPASGQSVAPNAQGDVQCWLALP
jgi:prepilin-type N-terminal cleavage/methylation domain-containing protein